MATVGSTQDIKTGSKTPAQLLNDLLREQFTGLSSNVTEGIGLFGENLGEQNQFFLGAADRFKRASEGVDPRFEAFRNSQRGMVSEQFERRGTGGSSAQRNALLRADTSLGFQEMGRQNDLLKDSLGARTAFLENSQLPIALQLQLAAQINSQRAIR